MFNFSFTDTALWLLFSTGFLSATLLPGGSEANFLFLLNQNHYSIATLVLVAALGNTFGGMTNYYIGCILARRTIEQKHSQKAINWLQRYGYWTLLLSWLPVIGDPLCLAAGWLGLKQRWCWCLIAAGKTSRYLLLALVARELVFFQ